MGVYLRLVKPNAPQAKKRFGQHFLRDTGVIDRIMRWISPAPGDVFLEIGAGDGALSSRLAPGVSKYLALEIDNDCIPKLQQTLAVFPAVIVIPADILQIDISDLLSPHLDSNQQIRIAGNLPYNIATVIIEKLLQRRYPIRDMYFMVQLEVAQRITASPGSRDYGFFSVYCQHHAEVQMGFKVSPACFVPRPKVQSSMVSIRPKDRDLNQELESAFDAIVKAAFSHRRKTIANSFLRNSALAEISGSILDRAGIDGTRRAEDLSVSEYERLAELYCC